MLFVQIGMDDLYMFLARRTKDIDIILTSGLDTSGEEGSARPPP
jgi:hypothetical protein